MAGILQYALSLNTGGFTSPLSGAQAKLGSFEASAGGATGGLSSLAAGALGAGTVIAGFAATLTAALGVLRSYAEYDGLVRGLRTLDGTADATSARLEKLREVAKVPGLGFEEAVRGDIRLRSIGMSAELSEKSMRAFGNALATVGGGKSDLDGVILALTQMAAKGKVSAEEINQISERVPQVRAAMKEAFGTADTEALGKAGIDATEFIAGLVAELGKIPQVTSGARNSLDNFGDSWKALKTTASEFFVTISAGFVDTFSTALKDARKALESMKEMLGIKSPGLEGKDGTTEAQRQADAEKTAREKAAYDAEVAAVKAHNDKIGRHENDAEEIAAFNRRKAAEASADDEKQRARVLAAVETANNQRLEAEANLQRRIANLKAQGPTGSKAFNETLNFGAKADILERTNAVFELEKELADLRKSNAEKASNEAEQAARKAESAERELTAQTNATTEFGLQNDLLKARADHDKKAVRAIENTLALEKEKLDIMQKQGLSADEALKKARERIALEKAASGEKPRGLLDAAASNAARLLRRSSADRAKDSLLNRDGINQADKLALDDAARKLTGTRGKPIGLDAAARELAKANRGNPAAAKAEAEKKAADAADRKAANDPLYKLVKSIDEQFKKLAPA